MPRTKITFCRFVERCVGSQWNQGNLRQSPLQLTTPAPIKGLESHGTIRTSRHTITTPRTAFLHHQRRPLPGDGIARTSFDTFSTMATLASRINQQHLLMQHPGMVHPRRPMPLGTGLHTQTTIGRTTIHITHKHRITAANPFLQHAA